MPEHHHAVVVRMPAMLQAVLHQEDAYALPLKDRENGHWPKTNDGAPMASCLNPDRAEEAMPHHLGVSLCYQGE